MGEKPHRFWKIGGDSTSWVSCTISGLTLGFVLVNRYWFTEKPEKHEICLDLYYPVRLS
jgi:hypothetical protein